MNKIEKAILSELNRWDLTNSQEKSTKEALAKELSRAVKDCMVSEKSSIPCDCGNRTFTHRHTNYIECTSCNKIRIIDNRSYLNQ
jgi:NADH pyrophosphatase NudC (nudix superfamily)